MYQILADTMIGKSMASLPNIPPGTSCLLDARGYRATLSPLLFGVAKQMSGEKLGLLLLIDRGPTADEDDMLKEITAKVPSLNVAVITASCTQGNSSCSQQGARQNPIELAVCIADDILLPPVEVLIHVSEEGHGKEEGVTASDITQLVSAAVQEVLGRALGPDEPLMDAGLTSGDAVTLVAALESSIGVDLPGTLAFDYPSVGAISNFLGSAVQSNYALACPEDPSVEDLTSTIADVVESVIGRRVGHEEPLMQAGLTSADAVTLVTALEETVGAGLPGTLVFDYPSLQAIASFLATEYGRGLHAHESGPSRDDAVVALRAPDEKPVSGTHRFCLICLSKLSC